MKQFKFNERQRFSIRKFSMGAASVLLGSVFFAVSSVEDVQAAEQSQNVVGVNENKQTPDPVILSNSSTTGVSTEETNTSVSAANVENKPEGDVVGSSKETLNKTALTKLIEDIDGKFTNGKYASKTEDSVNQLKTALDEANAVLNNAKTQEELTRAYNKLVTATTQLKTKPEEKKEAPAVDTTNGKATVGIKATNTEKATESNSIPNSGSKDERNGKALDTNNPFRTGATTTNDDPSANQTYEAPAENADLATLTNKLKTLPNYIENNKKVQDMNTLGDEKGVTAGRVAEITEFGGWKAVSQEDGSAGKFAIARKTEKGVFPIETVNVVGASKTAWLEEQSFNRDRNYMLFLSEVRTQATQNKESYNSQPYESNQKDSMGKIVSIGVKGYKGIEKRFKVYHSQDETKVNVQFKTGYSGLMEGDGQKSRAKYKVEVFSEVNGSESLVYSTEFDPGVNVDDAKKTVVAAVNGKPAKGSLRVTTAAAALEELSQDKYKPLGTGGTFTSKEITLPVGTNSYKVRISSANDRYLGMDYHSRFAQYALPITGLDFNINQDTGAIAKKLLSRIYDKLKATETADTDGKTNETKDAYLAELEKVKTLVTSTDVKKTAEYKEVLESTLSKQLALRVDKTGLIESKTLLDGLVNEDPTPGKTQDTATAYNAAKQEAIKAIEAAKTVIDNENATVAEVRDTLATVNAKKTALQQAKDGLIASATTAE
ncbi:YSIRK-type signal peptide-containing protein, partial [Streptococcus sp. 53]|uniref:YSIRK-type signal peptide-containing protein n=1 Tax=Streptococcus sp. 53 TaxID=2582679 RepID=UPI001564A4D9